MTLKGLDQLLVDDDERLLRDGPLLTAMELHFAFEAMREAAKQGRDIHAAFARALHG
jgi:hypothetical protein